MKSLMYLGLAVLIGTGACAPSLAEAPVDRKTGLIFDVRADGFVSPSAPSLVGEEMHLLTVPSGSVLYAQPSAVRVIEAPAVVAPATPLYGSIQVEPTIRRDSDVSPFGAWHPNNWFGRIFDYMEWNQ